MHPSVTFGDTSPCRGGFTSGCFPQRLPWKGSCRRMPTEGCGTLPHLYPCGLAGVCCIRRGRSPALTPALRAGESPKRRLRTAVISSVRKRCASRKICGTKRAGNRKAAAVGSFRGGRERPPYALPQMGAGKKTSAAKAKFPVSPAVCLALQGGRFRPPGNIAADGRRREKLNVYPKHCGGRQLCGTMQASSPTQGSFPPGRAA